MSREETAPGLRPRITVVVPNYNYGTFLEEALRSIVDQRYPNLELFVMDGGSTDNSVEIIRRYEPHLAYWQSKPDGGQARSINAALGRATGKWFNWINSDDLLLPNSLSLLAQVSSMVPEARWITGARLHLDELGHPCDICVPWRSDPVALLLGDPLFVQDGTFVQTDFLKAAGGIPEDFQNIFDSVLYARLMALEKPVLTTAVFSAMRWHGKNKSLDRSTSVGEIQRWRTGTAPWQRAASRALRTRLHKAIRGALLTTAANGLLPGADDWQAVVFDHNTAGFRSTTLSQVLYGANPG